MSSDGIAMEPSVPSLTPSSASVGSNNDQIRVGTPEPQAPLKGRQRLLKNLQRISSSPSLARGRRRAVSNPLTGRSTFSCVSLNAQSPLQNVAGLSTVSTSIPGTPGGLPPFYDDETFATRPVSRSELESGTATPSKVPLPSDLQPGAAGSVYTTPLAPDEIAGMEDYFSKPVTTSRRRVRRQNFHFWEEMPYELKLTIFGYLKPKELVRASIVSKSFHQTCFDGQLWTCFDASEFYTDIPAESLAKIIVAAGPFVKNLNLRGCVQVEHYQRAEVVVKACKNLINATLQGCRNFQRTTLHHLLSSNERLAHLNLTGLTAVNNMTCKIIAKNCAQLEELNVSWCTHMDTQGIRMVVRGCPRLRDLRIGEIRGFNNDPACALALFETNNLERLEMQGCTDLDDLTLQTIVHGVEPEIDILEDKPLVPARRLRYLDVSRCARLTNSGVQALAHLVPDLEGLSVAGCTALSDAALEKVLATTPRLTHLDLEEVSGLTDQFFSKHLAKAPCAPILECLTVSYCENIGDVGMLPTVRACTSLKSIAMDNTRISDLVLAEAVSMVRSRAVRTQSATARPRITLEMEVFDCSNVTWTGIREVLSRNAEIRRPTARSTETGPSFPTEVIALKCFHVWQMTVDEHMKRVMRGDFGSASKLERKWADYMIANEEAGAIGAGARRRRRRAREAAILHAHEEEDGANLELGMGRRRRARSGNCMVM